MQLLLHRLHHKWTLRSDFVRHCIFASTFPPSSSSSEPSSAFLLRLPERWWQQSLVVRNYHV